MRPAMSLAATVPTSIPIDAPLRDRAGVGGRTGGGLRRTGYLALTGDFCGAGGQSPIAVGRALRHRRLPIQQMRLSRRKPSPLIPPRRRIQIPRPRRAIIHPFA